MITFVRSWSMKVMTLFSKAGLNGFFFAMIAVVVLAWLFPEGGAPDSPLPLKTISDLGVAVIFFFYGLRLSPERLRAGVSQLYLHGVVQASTFLFFPVLVLLAYAFFYEADSRMIWIGTFYLAALPSTVSSSVVLVSIAGGNVAAAIFNASISSLIGIFLTPVWMSLFIDSGTLPAGDLGRIILDLCLQILLPVIAGLLLHHKLGSLTDRYRSQLRIFDQLVILLIVYRAFSESFAGNAFAPYSAGEILWLSLLMLGLFFLMLGIMSAISSLLKFSREDRITVIFCGSKKSLVQGAVMGQVLFPQTLSLGIILLPLMLYHALQLLAGSILAQRMARTTGNDQGLRR